MEQESAAAKVEELQSSKGTATTEKANKKKDAPTAKQLQQLQQEFIVQCDASMAPARFKGATHLLRCDLCKRHFETVSGAKGHTQDKKHVEKKNLKKVEEGLKLVGSPNQEQFDAITAKLEEVYSEWSAEASGQLAVRKEIVSDFEKFVKTIHGCEDIIVELFGSTHTGFALKDSDINMNLTFTDHVVNSSSAYYTAITGIKDRLVDMAGCGGAVYTDLVDNLYSPVSHIVFRHRLSGLSCHVRFGSHHGVPIYTSKLLRRYAEVDCRVKMLAVVLKLWAKLCQLDVQELGSYPSQTFVLLLIHFLQQRTPPILPVPPKPKETEFPQCLDHFDEYLSGLDHMIQIWRTTNTESLGMLWLGLLRFYCEETDIGNVIVQITQPNLLLKKDTSWSTNKLVVLSPVNATYNLAKACSSQNMYLYFKICFKATMVYFGRNSLQGPITIPTGDHSKSQKATLQEQSHDLNGATKDPHAPAATGDSSPTHLIAGASHLSDDNQEQLADSTPENLVSIDNTLIQTSESCGMTCGSHSLVHEALHDLELDDSVDLDHVDTPHGQIDSDALCDLDHDVSPDVVSIDRDHDVSQDIDSNHDESYDDVLSTSEAEVSCDQSNTHQEDSVKAEDNTQSGNGSSDVATGELSTKQYQYEFDPTHFVVKRLPNVCSVCRQEGHLFNSPDCPDKEEKITVAKHPQLSHQQLKNLDKVFVQLKDDICLKPEDKSKRREVCKILEKYVKVIYPKAELVLFGSSANDFGSPASDVDISMKLPGSFEHDDKAEVIQTIAKGLKNNRQGHWWQNTVQPITTARVPIVKITLMPKWDELECDISLGNYLALHNTELLSTYASIDHRVQVLGYVLKEFAKSSDMCDASSGSLSSYAYILLLLHYLQQTTPPVIPVLQEIGEPGQVDVDGWNCWFYRFDDISQLEKLWPHVRENKSSIGELLMNFFKYYLEEFDWKTRVVCIRQLKSLSKLEKNWASRRTCIEDPFNHEHNLSSHLSNKMWIYIRNAFKCAHDHIANPQLYSMPLTIQSVLSVGFTKNVPQDGLCHTCGKRGHISRNCPQTMMKKRQQRVCFLCHKPGHVQSHCPELDQTDRNESPGGGVKQPPAEVEEKVRRKSRTPAKVSESKPAESMKTFVSPDAKRGPLLPQPNQPGYPIHSPVKQSSPLLYDPSAASPPRNTATQLLPPYPQSSPSVPYSASRHHLSTSPGFNQTYPTVGHTRPMGIPSAGPTRPYFRGSSPQRMSPRFAYNSPPRHIQHPPHLISYGHHQSPPMTYPLGMLDSSVNAATTNRGYYYGQQQCLFPPPTVPADALLHGLDVVDDPHQQTEQYYQPHQSQQHPTMGPVTATVKNDSWPEFTGEAPTSQKPKKSKYRRSTRHTKQRDETMTGVAGSTGLPSQNNASDSKQGKSAVRTSGSNQKQHTGRGRGRTPRNASADGGVGYHGSREGHQKR